MKENKVLILMGSDSDRKVVESALPYFKYFGIAVEVKVSSAHRHPEQTAKLAANARENGFKAIVCAAGMAAHLAGVCAAHSDLPVIGVPLSGGALDGLDALLSTVRCRLVFRLQLWQLVKQEPSIAPFSAPDCSA